MYKVLWFDDEHETLELIKQEALLNDIQLIGYSNAREGLKALNEDPKLYDAILLDGLFLKNEDQSKDDVTDEAFGEVAKTLGLIKERNIIIPWFIYSGQPNFVKDNNVLVNLFKDQAFANGKIFNKNKDEDFPELCNEIKKAVNNQPITQARHDNLEIFMIFKDGYLSSNVEDNVLQLLIQSLPQNNTEFKGMLTNIRSIQESCFNKLKGINVIPSNLSRFTDELKHLSGNMTWNSTLRKYEPKSTIYQSHEIELLQSYIYKTCGSYIHYLDNQNYGGYMISNYTIESLRQGLLEILLWFRKTYHENK